jgi:hypothetical protein
MKNLNESVVEEFRSYQNLISEDESVDFNILDGEEFRAREADILNEVIPEETRHFEAMLESIPLKFVSKHFIK